MVLCAISVLLLAACGSTVPVATTGQLSIGVGADTQTVSAPLGATAAGSSLPTSASVRSSKGSITTSSSAAADPSAPEQSGSSSAGTSTDSSADHATAIATKGPGWDAAKVYIGLVEIRDSTTAMQAAGLKSVATGDQEAQGNAVADYFNSRGGLFGRKIQIVYDNHANANVQAQPNVEAQASCTKFTQDQRVVAVVNTQTGIDTPNYRECLSKAGIPLFGVSISPIDDAALKDARGLFYPVIVPTWNRFAPVFAKRLNALGYFHGWDTANGRASSTPSKLGAYIHDDPASERSYQLAARAFAAIGHAPALVVRWQNYNDASNAVLQFRSAGITHVFGLDAAQFLFAVQAESQHYRPRYAVQTGNGPGVAMEANAPAAQNVGALGVGTAPAMDINHALGDITPGGKLCRQIFASHGQNFTGAYFTEAFAYSICDSIRALVAGFQAGSGLTTHAFQSGLGRVGSSFPPAMTFGSGLSATYPVFPGVGRDIGWQTQCSCYNYLNSTVDSF